MHLFAQLLLNDLEESRNELVRLFKQMTPEQWKNKIPENNKTVHELASHILSDSQRLAIFAPIVGMDELFPKANTSGQYDCVWSEEKITLSPENILAGSAYERNKLSTLLTFVKDKKQAEALYESDFQTGWHERMHFFDLQQALAAGHEYVPILQDSKDITEQLIKQLDVMAILYGVAKGQIDEISQTNKTYRQEIKMLSHGKFIDAIHRWLDISDHTPRLKGSADIMQQIHHIHGLRNDMITHISTLQSEQLEALIDGKSLVKRLQKIVLDFQAKMRLFKKINLRDSWARKTGL